MPLIPSSTLVYAHAGTLLTIAYFLLTAPVQLLTSAAFIILGEAMHIRAASFQPSPSRLQKGLPALSAQSTQLLAIVGVVLASYALTQLIFAAGLAVPGSLVQKKQSGGGGRATADTGFAQSRSHNNAGKGQRGEELHTLVTAQAQYLNVAFVHVAVAGGLCAALGDVLGNQVVFSVALVDMLFWGYLWTVIREERREVVQRVQQIRAEEEEEESKRDD
ncbi:hypothetical protein DV737_g3001, partial [Chaetothyriales sp. CBS 132003]